MITASEILLDEKGNWRSLWDAVYALDKALKRESFLYFAEEREE